VFEDSGCQDLGSASAADLAAERDDEQDGQHGAGQDNGGGHVCSLAGFSGEWVKKRQNARPRETDVSCSRALLAWGAGIVDRAKSRR